MTEDRLTKEKVEEAILNANKNKEVELTDIEIAKTNKEAFRTFFIDFYCRKCGDKGKEVCNNFECFDIFYNEHYKEAKIKIIEER